MTSLLLPCAGYGFSAAPTKPGFGVGEIAKTFHELMLKLGYNKYVAQGRHPYCFVLDHLWGTFCCYACEASMDMWRVPHLQGKSSMRKTCIALLQNWQPSQNCHCELVLGLPLPTREICGAQMLAA